MGILFHKGTVPVEIGMPGYLAGTFSDPVLLASQAEEASQVPFVAAPVPA